MRYARFGDLERKRNICNEFVLQPAKLTEEKYGEEWFEDLFLEITLFFMSDHVRIKNSITCIK